MSLSFQERNNIGDNNCEKFESKCRSKNIIYLSTKNAYKWSSDFDLRHGDYIIFPKDLIIRVDVKGGGISQRSLESFIGEYFILYESSNENFLNGIVINASKLKQLKFNYNQGMKLSGDNGIQYPQIISAQHQGILEVMTIDDFFDSL